MSGTQIDPTMIPGTDIDPQSIEASAASYRSTATKIGSSADAVLAGWAGLSGVYSAPESPQLLAAMNPVGVDSHAVAATLTSAAGLLDELAEAVVAPVNRLKELKKEAEEFVASVRGGVTVPFGDPDYPSLIETGGQAGGTIFNPHDEVIGWSEHSPSVDRNNELLEQVAAEVAKLSAASADCVNGINALRTDTCIAPHEAVTAEQLIAAEGLPWGEIGKGDRSCSESVNDGMFEFGKGIVGGVVALGGFDIDNGWAQSADFAGKAWTGLASGLGALVITLTNPSAIGMAYLPDEAVPDWAEGAQSWYRGNLENIVGGIVGTPEQWEEDPVAAGTYAVLSIGTFFIPVAGQAGAAAKVTSALARAGTATQRLVALTGDSLRLSNGLTHTGALLTRLSTSLDGLTSGSAGMRSLDQVATALNDIPDVVPDNLVAARTAEGRTDVGDGSDSRASEMRPADTTHSVGGNASSGSGGGGGGGTAVLERTDLGDASIPADRGGSGDPPTERGGMIDTDSGSTPPGSTPSGSTPSLTQTARPHSAHQVEVPASGAPGPRTPFTARTDLEPNTRYHVEGRGDYFTDATGRVTHVETSYGGAGNLNADLMRPQPDTTYVVHPNVSNPLDGVNHSHVFHTDSEGRTDLAHTDALGVGDADRSGSVQSRVGSEGGIGYEGGHLFANGFGGGGEYSNLVAMLRDVNRGSGDSFFNLENQWRAMLRENPDVRIEVDIQPQYQHGSRTPESVGVKYSIDGGPLVKKFFINE